MSYFVKRFIVKCLLMVAKLSIWPIKGVRARILKHAGVQIESPQITYIGENVVIDSIYPEDISIGKNTVIAVGSVILTHYFTRESLAKEYHRRGKVVIGRNVFIGAKTIICNSISIGDNSVVGAGSIVTKDIPANQVWAGNPAKYIKDIPND